mmetsp:Transcript_5377/g.8342  ORF Transcript_5377/g.8342 Transcript_5377/m.8342 type:complete len:241 (-) Transcript_5377:559-1281(-)
MLLRAFRLVRSSRNGSAFRRSETTFTNFQQAFTIPQRASQRANMSSYKIYTRTGDEGISSLYNGERRPKSDDFFEALGAADELNAAIGVAREFCKESNNGLDSQLEEIQSRLIDVGSAVATPRSSSDPGKLERVKFDTNNVDLLETWIDAIDVQLPALTNFILPSGGRSSSFLHVARTACRRAERTITPLVRAREVEESVLRYMNRLSDYLFMAARLAALKEGQIEVIYKKGVGKTQRAL